MCKKKLLSIIISTFTLLVSVGALIGVSVACGFYNQIAQTGFNPDALLAVGLFLSLTGLVISIVVILMVVMQDERD